MPCPGAVAVAEQFDPSAAEAGADIGAEPVVGAEVEQAVEHARKDADVAVEVEVGGDQRRKTRGP